MAARNSSDIYARSDSSGVQGSKIVISPAVLPVKSTSVTPTNATDYALLFDDVAYNAASNTYSGIGVVSGGDITIKGRTGSASFGSAVSLSTSGAVGITSTAAPVSITSGANVLTIPISATAPITLNSIPALGGPAGVSGFVGSTVFSNLVNCNTISPHFASYVVIGRFCRIDFRATININGAGVVQFDMGSNIQDLALAVAGSSSEANGVLLSLEPATFYGEAVAGTKTVRFTSGAGFTIATPDIITGSFIFYMQ